MLTAAFKPDTPYDAKYSDIFSEINSINLSADGLRIFPLNKTVAPSLTNVKDHRYFPFLSKKQDTLSVYGNSITATVFSIDIRQPILLTFVAI